MENQITPLTFSEKNTVSVFSDMKAGHVGILTTKYNEILDWYERNLDFRIIRKWMVGDIQLAFIAPPNDNQFIIEIICYDSNEKTNDDKINSGYNHLSFSVQNLDETIKELVKRNIPIERSFSVPVIGLRVAFISDTFGNTIEFCEELK
ncbi:MAG: VOC family protein [Sphingobacteriaceae bacterium]|nr:MAG: VOC family protein [Sphingobacteriaceae bacterium]